MRLYQGEQRERMRPTNKKTGTEMEVRMSGGKGGEESGIPLSDPSVRSVKPEIKRPSGNAHPAARQTGVLTTVTITTQSGGPGQSMGMKLSLIHI